MSFEDIEKSWRSPGNRPTPEEMEREKSRCLATLRNRQRGFAVGMTLVFTALTIITGVVLKHWLWPDSAKGQIHLQREWAVVPLLALPWIAGLLFVRQYRRQRQQHPQAERSIADSLRAMAAHTRLSVTRKKTMLGMHLISLPVLALSVSQLYEAGKARPHEVASMAAVFAVLIVVSVCGIGYELVRGRRELTRLETLLRDYEAGA